MSITHENLHIFTIPKEMSVHHSFKEYFNIPIRIEQHSQTLLMSIVVTDKNLKYEYSNPEEFIEHITRQYDRYVEDNEQKDIKRQAECKVILDKYKKDGIPNDNLFDHLKNVNEDQNEKEESFTDLLQYAQSFLDNLDDFEEDDYGSLICGYKDCEDVLEIAYHFDRDDFKEACRKASNLDTFVREGIPESTWAYFLEEAKEWD